MCRRNVRSPTPSNRAASSWLSRPPRQPPYASSNLIIRVSCRHSVRLIATSSEVAMKTGQITCYNPGQIMCSQHGHAPELTFIASHCNIMSFKKGPGVRHERDRPEKPAHPFENRDGDRTDRP